ncbi:MAG: ACP S-malonyltransferase [Candidatus Aceula meridiana]|nr:ACP S-malonyltransferase [Candidatus Aceula meridiana]
MGKTVFLFPGQGSQEVGMGHDLFRQDDYFISLVNKASEHVGEDLKKICLKGPEKKMAKACFLQPLIVAVSLGYLRYINEKRINVDYVLGHSLGEITVLAAAGVIDNSLAIAIAAKRGQLMDEAAANCDGGMMAVLSVTPQEVQRLISSLGLQDTVVVANFNTPNQTVVSGNRSSFDQLSLEIVKSQGTCKKLNVAGPWHSPYLKDAYEQFKIWAESIVFKTPNIPLILNSTGQPESDPLKIKECISASLINPVRFTECMKYCEAHQVDTFLEIGPGRVLSGLVRANGFMETTRIYKVNNLRGVELAASELLAKK